MSLTHEEMIEILKEIAREGTNAAAWIAAIKTFMEVAPRDPDTGLWAELDELAPRRDYRRTTVDRADARLAPPLLRHPGGFEGCSLGSVHDDVERAPYSRVTVGLCDVEFGIGNGRVPLDSGTVITPRRRGGDAIVHLEAEVDPGEVV